MIGRSRASGSLLLHATARIIVITATAAIKMGNLWCGFSVCAARAVIVNSINFWIYESVKDWFTSS